MRSSIKTDSDTIRGLHKIELSIQTGVMLHLLLRPAGNQTIVNNVRTATVEKGVANRRGTATMTGLSRHPIVLIRLRGINSHAIMGENAIAMIGTKTPCVREI